MPIYQQKAAIVRTEQISADIYRLTVRAPDMAAAARPGQFFMVKVGSGSDPLLRRPFSVHQVEEGGLVQILFKVVGRGTRMLATGRTGQHLELLGPLGRGFAINSAERYYLIGGGIGTAPLLFLAGQLVRQHDSSVVTVLLGARTGDEIAALADDFAALGLAVRTITEDGSMGGQGLVTELLLPLPPGKTTMVYGCGPHPMLRAIAGICQNNGAACQVSLEALMACGLGACLGCAVPRADMKGYLHVCKDGPVIDANEVAWL